MCHGRFLNDRRRQEDTLLRTSGQAEVELVRDCSVQACLVSSWLGIKTCAGQVSVAQIHLCESKGGQPALRSSSQQEKGPAKHMERMSASFSVSSPSTGSRRRLFSLLFRSLPVLLVMSPEPVPGCGPGTAT